MFNHKVLLEQYELLGYKLSLIRKCNLPVTYYVDDFEINDEFVGVYFKHTKNKDDCFYITFTWDEIENPTNLNHKFKQTK